MQVKRIGGPIQCALAESCIFLLFFFFLEGIRRSYQRIPDLSQLSFACKLDKTGPDRFGAFKTGFTAT